ncbi:MAG TPA: threonine synthase [Limnochordales bacterium]
MSGAGIIARYRPYLSLPKDGPIITLQEGDTPLIPAPALAKELGLPAELYLKYEGANPTGSFKDRGMTMAVTDAVMRGARAIICASTGNTSASAAAYAARAGLPCYVLIPKGNVAKGKLAQTMMHGARVVEIEGNFDQALALVREMADAYGLAIVNSINPVRLEGQKTAAFEICDVLGEPPDFLALPVGNAGNITAYWKGFKEYLQLGKIRRLPRLLGFQAAGAAPIVEGRPIRQPETVATAIRIGNPASWQYAVAARDESGGLIAKVTDEEILAAYRLVARLEGVFCEPASAASVAGVAQLARQGFFQPGQRVVCVLTGHGLKDPDRAAAEGGGSIVLPARADALAEVLAS